MAYNGQIPTSQPYQGYTNPYQQQMQQPDVGSYEWVNSAEEVQSKNVGTYMNRNEPVMYKKFFGENGLQFEVYDLVKREPIQNAGNFVTRDELAALIAKTVRDEMKKNGNRKEHTNG